MRKIILNLAVSLDGLIEGPNGEYDWCFTDQDYGFTAFLESIDTIFMGRKSYEMMAGLEDENMKFPSKKKYVFTNSLKEVSDGFTILSGDIAKKINTLRSEEGKDIWLFGGAELTTSMMKMDLVDELSMAIHPILLGQGKPLFQNLEGRRYWELLDVDQYSSGMVILSYKRSKS